MGRIKNFVRPIIRSKSGRTWLRVMLDKLNPIRVIAYPKAGRTWLRVMLDLLNIHLIYLSGGVDYGPTLFNKDLDPNKSKYKNKKVILLIRDPLDIVTSFYFQAIKREKFFEGSISEFIKNENYGIKNILNFYNDWFKSKTIPKDFLLVRYEEIRNDTLTTLKKIINFLNVKNITEENMKKVIKFTEFENMQKLEKSGFFKKKYGSMLLPGNKDDIEYYMISRIT